MTHEDRPYELHDDFLSTLTRERYLKFRHIDTLSFSTSSPSHHEPSKLKTSFSGESKHQTPSESQTALNNYKKGPQRKAFFSQQEEISDDDVGSPQVPFLMCTLEIPQKIAAQVLCS